jgi:long-chain fatty acid adenylyltransferase FadD28
LDGGGANALPLSCTYVKLTFFHRSGVDGEGTVTPVIAPSIPGVLRERASLQPNDTAFTFIDYEQDWDGVAQNVTWSQLYRRTLNLAQELRLCGSEGDRAVILAPQGLDYIGAFLGALQAGFIAVPLSAPIGGATDERVVSVLRDASPSVVLTTSAVVGKIAEYIEPLPGVSAPSVVEVDVLDLDSRKGSSVRGDTCPDTAYLQYTSGSTRSPAGVMLSYGNVLANFEQFSADYFADYGKIPSSDSTFVSWLPFYHDMGLVLGIVFPILAGLQTAFTSPVAFLERPARWMQLLVSNTHAFCGAPNFAFELAVKKHRTTTWQGLISAV